jgi:pimeloyl-ACP methyl ester carboxylesterase
MTRARTTGASAFCEEYFKSADGLRLYYRDYPARAGTDGTTVICLHGLTRNCRDFEDLAIYLSDTRRVLVPDIRGRGRSDYDPHWRNYHPEQYVDDAWCLLDSLGIENVIVIGTSQGGLMAMLMTAGRPGAVDAIVLNDAGPKIEPAGIARLASYVGRLTTVSNWEEATEQTKQVNGVTLPGLPEEAWARLSRRVYREINGKLRLDSDPNIGLALQAGILLPRADLWTLFDALTDTPTLALRGQISDILSVDTLDAMKSRKPDLVCATIPERGHTPLLNEPEAIRALSEFLQKL